MLRWRPPGRENAGRNTLDHPTELAVQLHRIYVLSNGRHRRERNPAVPSAPSGAFESAARRVDGPFLLVAAHWRESVLWTPFINTWIAGYYLNLPRSYPLINPLSASATTAQSNPRHRPLSKNFPLASLGGRGEKIATLLDFRTSSGEKRTANRASVEDPFYPLSHGWPTSLEFRPLATLTILDVPTTRQTHIWLRKDHQSSEFNSSESAVLLCN